MIPTIPDGTDFTRHNLPWGIFSTTTSRAPRVGIAYGDHIIDLAALSEHGVFDFDASVLYEDALNPLIELGKTVTNGARSLVQELLGDEQSVLTRHPELFVNQEDATLHLPIRIGDYTDFYSSIEHATNVGKLFRDPENALLPNWRHLPVGYHGRAGSIVVSGTDIRRPHGQVKPNHYKAPAYEASSRLDFELEMGFIIGKDTTLGKPVSIEEAEDYIFGLVLVNDWSARDIQKWEYQPLGPFLGKNFATTISPWVVPLEALAPYRSPAPEQQPNPLPYLQQPRAKSNIDIALNVDLELAEGGTHRICESNTKHLYWSMAQQLAHHTVNGCNVRVGDLLASGTISGPTPGSYGSLLELAEGGRKELTFGNQTRTFLEDGDRLILSAAAGEGDRKVGFGQAAGRILPAHT